MAGRRSVLFPYQIRHIYHNYTTLILSFLNLSFCICLPLFSIWLRLSLYQLVFLLLPIRSATLPLKPSLLAGSATQHDVMILTSSGGASEGMTSKFGRLPFSTHTAMSDSFATGIYDQIEEEFPERIAFDVKKSSKSNTQKGNTHVYFQA